ncbi:MAG: lysine biosynthesis protein LysW [Candidatus Komeilibacteria bacterium CG10_big_fil_rev_8_21_14_0_10_41_13]|uniref:Lysine biosynthesis protein LysW n=1 Tax=Candidatus Komeilibacteria bacterium CG10_big_fil_rev_8_21_14_0_10_41_13 TaxID=1974476 RepID=A0A2M6WC41_9BACT|nr:MAG: lysine biosynthesis protein LysW [Candidatus Komeilibacteria bacterium CG10_big_fil_rev_8_21_14_0_10_41_13]
MVASCPQCAAEVSLPEGAELNELLTCQDCQAELEIKELGDNSAVLEAAPAEEEDWGQ